MWSVSEAREYQFKRCHATHQQPLDRALRCLGIDYMGPFPMSKGYEYILLAIDYVSKWVKAMPCRAADAKNPKQMFEEIIFPRFGVLRMVISVAPSFKNKTRYTPYVSPGSQISHIATNKVISIDNA